MELFSGRMLMFWFCLLQFLNFVERGAVSSNSVKGQYTNETCSKQCSDSESLSCRNECGFDGIQGEWNLTDAEMGLLASMFTGGLTIASPISAHMVRLVHPFAVIGFGQLIFTLALFGAGFSTNFWMLLGFRTLVGVSEPSFIVVAPAMIDIIAPPERRSLWMAAFYMCISLGSAGGLMLGTIVKAAGGNWQWAFWVQAIINLPLALLFIFSRPAEFSWEMIKCASPPMTPSGPLEDGAWEYGEAENLVPLDESVGKNGTHYSRRNPLRAMARASMGFEESRSAWEDIKELLRSRRYIFLVTAYSLMMAVSGVILFWGPKAGKDTYKIEEHADIYFGAMVVVSGISGTLVGGWLLDRLGGGYEKACKVCAIQLVIAGVLCTLSFWIPPSTTDPNVYAFFALFSIGYFCVASFYGPATSTLLWVCDPALRAQSVGLATLIFHIFGDIPSPWYAGAIHDYGGLSWQWTFTVLCPVLILSGLIFVLAILPDGSK
eukprot:TRINITY_DN3673_c0_g1_i2.p1 TRINITY_DN3673_c0_g1~~TRINITY_DN3673_c0_g1_i2.p1  ORF type:complete len:491 (+),score=150.06 TRINITY_DN3673_c0_g1_i2:52-1524(+)